MPASRETYSSLALTQVPRLLSLQDRNPFSPTYGCFHRDYWLFKTSDFPDAVRQFGVHALALVYAKEFPDNPFYQAEKIRAWTVAGLRYWASIQHRDGSFDEFYPYERGWVGPSAFTTYTATEALNLLGDNILPSDREFVVDAIHRAARFIARGESEEDHLANHHAMACLATWKAFKLLDDPALKIGFEHRWEAFLGYHNPREGWSREYDGVDPGYLSATVSFLGKVYAEYPDPAIRTVLDDSVRFCQYFAYPNRHYAGSLGSRNTLHFYPHGFELLAADNPLAAAVAERMLEGLQVGALVPPGIQADRYVFYRVPEFLLSYLDYTSRPANLPLLPDEARRGVQYFPDSRIDVRSATKYHSVANLAKGGVVKIFGPDGKLLLNDCGVIGQLTGGEVVTTQWIAPDYAVRSEDDHWTVSGTLQVVPSNKLFTPFTLILFRAALVALGWIPAFAHFLKGRIRKSLILNQQSLPVTFSRTVQYETDTVTVRDELQNRGTHFTRVSIGDEFFVRYVPQSRYFQPQELEIAGLTLDARTVSHLNAGEKVTVTRQLDLSDGIITTTVS